MSVDAANPDNPTRAFVAQVIDEGRRDVALDINPALASLGAVLVEGTRGKVTIRFTAARSCTQGNGVVCGGTLATMLDHAMAMAVLSELGPGRTCATVSLSVNMQAAAQQGDMVAMAQVDRVGRQVAFARAELFDVGQSRRLANATSSLVVIDVKP